MKTSRKNATVGRGRPLGWAIAAALIVAGPAAGEEPRSTEAARGVWRSQRMCGVNCLYSYLSLRGRKADYASLTGDLLAEETDTSLSGLGRAARRHGLSSTLGRTDQEGLLRLDKPLIAHCEMLSPAGATSGHYVLVLKTEAAGVTYLDGTTAEFLMMSWQDFARIWTGFVVYEPRPSSRSWWWVIAPLVAAGLAVGAVGERALRLLATRLSATRADRAAAATTAALMALALPASISAAEPVPEAVLAAYETHRSKLGSVLARYEVVGERLIDAAEIFRHLRYFDPPRVDGCAVLIGDKVFAELIQHDRDLGGAIGALAKGDSRPITLDTFPYEQLSAAANRLPRTKNNLLVAYDGAIWWNNTANGLKVLGETKAVYEVMRPKKAKYRTLPITYFDLIGYGPIDPSQEAEARVALAHRLPDLLRAIPFESGPGGKVDGVECLLVEANDVQRFWLDPSLGYAIRRREVMDGGRLATRYQCREFVEIVPGVWMPKLVEEDQFATPGMAPQYQNKPVLRIRYKVAKLEANSPGHAEFFRPNIPPGSFVLDSTVQPLDASGRPIETKGPVAVQYMQPADAAQLDGVLTQARRETGLRLEDSGRAVNRLWIYASVGTALLILALGVVLIRRSAPRDPHSPPGST